MLIPLRIKCQYKMAVSALDIMASFTSQEILNWIHLGMKKLSVTSRMKLPVISARIKIRSCSVYVRCMNDVMDVPRCSKSMCVKGVLLHHLYLLKCW